MKSIFAFIFALIIFSGTARAQDERSIQELTAALSKLSPTVDPHEAELLSTTAHHVSRELAKRYGVGANPSFHNFLINIGARKYGFCADYVHDIGERLKEFRFKTLELHWGAAYPKEADENNCLVITARHQSFRDGIVLDAWRHAGRLFWCRVTEDREFSVGHSIAFALIPGHNGVTPWKEDPQGTAWLQEIPPPPLAPTPKSKPKARPSPSICRTCH